MCVLCACMCKVCLYLLNRCICCMKTRVKCACTLWGVPVLTKSVHLLYEYMCVYVDDDYYY